MQTGEKGLKGLNVRSQSNPRQTLATVELIICYSVLVKWNAFTIIIVIAFAFAAGLTKFLFWAILFSTFSSLHSCLMHLSQHIQFIHHLHLTLQFVHSEVQGQAQGIKWQGQGQQLKMH